MDARRYYSDLTVEYERYARGTHGWHYGCWEPDVRSHRQALIRSNELLVRGLDLGPASHVLDVGFGSGGFSVWTARSTGARVTGITLSPDHVPLAERLAREAGVGGRCRFLVMNMDALAFADETFDLVVNQETFCHAGEKARYLEAVHRVLRQGGSWRAVDFSIAERASTPADDDRRRRVCEGFHLPSLTSASEARAALTRIGFEAVDARDITPLVLKTAARIIRNCYATRFVFDAGADRLLWPCRPETRRNRIGHLDAGVQYSRGLKRGTFRHVFYSAQRAKGSAPARAGGR